MALIAQEYPRGILGADLQLFLFVCFICISNKVLFLYIIKITASTQQNFFTSSPVQSLCCFPSSPPKCLFTLGLFKSGSNQDLRISFGCQSLKSLLIFHSAFPSFFFFTVIMCWQNWVICPVERPHGVINTFFSLCTFYRLRFGSCCSVAQSCPALCDPRHGSMPGFPVPHYLLEFAQTHVC